MWDIFGMSERFRGPYITPNILGYNIVILCILTGTTKSKFRIPAVFMALIILLLSGSKISLFAFFIHIMIRTSNFTYDKLKKSINSDSENYKKNIPSKYSNHIIYLVVFFLSAAGYLSDPTLNGRTDNYNNLLQNLNGHYFLGNGPAFASSVYSTENTFLTLYHKQHYSITCQVSYEPLLFFNVKTFHFKEIEPLKPQFYIEK
jgi:hypothetical protein